MKKITLLLFLIVNFATAQNINFTDFSFKTVLLTANAQNIYPIAKDLDGNTTTIDTNNDGEIQVSEAMNISFLDALGMFSNIQNIEGIEYFQNLKTLSIIGNQLTTVNLSNNVLLERIYLHTNSITMLDFSNLPNLIEFDVHNNPLTVINLNANNDLERIYCGYSLLSNLNLTQCPNLMELNCPETLLTTIELTGTKVTTLTTGGTNLETIFAKNGLPSNIQIFDSPNLRYLCIDENEMSSTTLNVLQNLLPNCVINTYCSFVPGGTYYTAEGNVKLDTNSNGCDVADVNLPNLKLNVYNGSTTGLFFSKTNGNYLIPLQSGSYTIAPVLENPSYFSLQPTIFTADFPEDTSPLNQAICLSPNGIRRDLEINYIRLPRTGSSPSTPGYNVRYKIIYKNKGNQVQSGQVRLNYQDEVMNYTGAVPDALSVANGTITWNFTDLLPFETRTIIVTFLLNSPQDSPPLDGGDELSFDAEIEDLQWDDFFPEDNFFNLTETAQSSMDPNDITCLEGNTVGPDQIGKYVHYLIQFENIGTADATNVVVKNSIDPTKFDVNSLIPLDSNYSFETRRKNNDYEFIFENINLPFNNDDNDGYLVYKIKLRNTLTVGSTFTNQANIYFDFNFPILTNVASTTIETLNTSTFNSSKFKIAPNPTDGELIIQLEGESDFTIELYNLIGEKVAHFNNQKNIDVSHLTAGIYVLKVTEDESSSVHNFKLIKK